MISSFLLVPAGVPWLVSLLFFPFSGRGLCSIMIFWFILVPGSVPGLVSPVLSFLFSGIRPPMTSLLHMNVVETWFVAVWGLRWCNLYLLYFLSLFFVSASNAPQISSNEELLI